MFSTAPPIAEKRTANRFLPTFGTIFRIHPKGLGLVWNISSSGISMSVADPPEPGSEVYGELAHETGDEILSIRIRVVHVRKSETGDFILGGQFVRRLNEDEVRPFITPPHSPQNVCVD